MNRSKAIGRALQQFAELVDGLAARVAVIEERLADLDKKHELVESARKTWRVWGRAGPDVILISDSTETASIPVSVARVIASGHTLDAAIRDIGGDQVELVRGDRVLARLPRAAMATLPRVLSGPGVAETLGSVVPVPVCASGTARGPSDRRPRCGAASRAKQAMAQSRLPTGACSTSVPAAVPPVPGGDT